MSDQSTICTSPVFSFKKCLGGYEAEYTLPADERPLHKVGLKFRAFIWRAHKCSRLRQKSWDVCVYMSEDHQGYWKQQASADDARGIATLREAKARVQQFLEVLVALYR